MFLRSVAAAAVLALSGVAAQAGTTAGTPFTVQITITAGCTINTGPSGTIDFGSNAGTGPAPADIASSVAVTCTNTSPYNVYFTSSNTVTGNTNRVMSAGGSDTVGYQIRLTSTSAAIGDTAATGISGTGNGASQSYPINFHINAWAPVAPAVYTDTVTMHVDF